MEKEIITPKQSNVKRDFKFRISYDNGASDTIHTSVDPQLDKQIPMFMNFFIKVGTVRHVNLQKVRTMDVDINESVDLSI
jgi:hypothetical protein